MGIFENTNSNTILCLNSILIILREFKKINSIFGKYFFFTITTQLN